MENTEPNNQRKISPNEKRALAVATVIAILFGAFFLKGYFTLIVFAAIMAFLANPFYHKRVRANHKPGTAGVQAFIITLVAILIPLIILLIMTGFQINQIVREVTAGSGSLDIPALSAKLINQINAILASTPIQFRITGDWLQSSILGLIQKIGMPLLNNLGGYVGSLAGLITSSIIFVFVFVSLLRNQVKLRHTIREINPLGVEISDLYMSRISAMTRAMVRGQFIIAIIQGLVDAILVYLGGFHEAFFILFLLMSVLSFIPLGGGIIAMPIGVIMILTGNWLGGLLVIIGHLLIVTNIDNILRPQLVPAEAKLDSALLVLSVFAGLSLFGFLGIIIGPVIMITIVTTIRVYLEVYRDYSLT